MIDPAGTLSHTIANYRDSGETPVTRDDMSESWKRWEGRIVDGRFPLQAYLGGSDHSAAFLTQRGEGDSQKAAIKLISADALAEKQLTQWKAARDLNHPNLISIFEAGSCELDGTKLLYVVEEFAEENLSQILPERALTVEETHGMLPSVLQALQFVHDKGFVHGQVKPANILAIGDRVKLSNDTLRVPGESSRRVGVMSAYDPPEAATGTTSAPSDVWQLGMMLVEVLTQHLPIWERARSTAPEVPETIPEPFREIVGHCLQVDAGKRWTIAEISNRTGTEQPKPIPAQVEMAVGANSISSQPKQSAKWPYLLGLAAVVAIIVFLIVRSKPPGSSREVQSTEVQPRTASENAQSAPNTTSGVDERTPTKADESGVVRRVMPQVSPSARRTIQGKIKVRVKVEVDAAGNVAKAKLESAGPSRYFSRVALEAAREWRFAPVQAGESGAREWKLQFAFSRAKTEASAMRGKR